MSDITHIFSYWMKFYRTQKKITQEELAERTNLHRTYIGSVERAERNITLKNADIIANALEIPLYDMVKEFSNENE